MFKRIMRTQMINTFIESFPIGNEVMNINIFFFEYKHGMKKVNHILALMYCAF